MSYRIWSSLPKDRLLQIFREMGVRKTMYRLAKTPAKAEVLFGELPAGTALPKQVKWFQLDSSDTRGLASSKDLTVTNLAGLFAQPIAESILGSMLADLRGLYQCRDAQHQQGWKRWDIRKRSRTLQGRRIGILGGGAIVRALISLLRPFGCEITVFRRSNSRSGLGKARVLNRVADLEKALSEFSVLINTLPAADETFHFLNASRLAKLPSDAVIVNAGRGSTVDEEALLVQLRQGRFSAVILDVTQVEPLPRNHPLWTQERVHLTQHTFGGHMDEVRKKCEFFASNFKRFSAGSPLKNQVN